MTASPQSIAFAEKLAFLCEGGVFPEGEALLETMETHLSWVFLTANHAYKLKKPLRTRVIDLTTLAARACNAERELHLNRRLAGSLYEGVHPLLCEASRGLRLGLRMDGVADWKMDPAQVVDWLVRMRRLPAHHMLDALIRQRRIKIEEIDRLGRYLGAFYRTRPRLNLDPVRYVSSLRATILADGAALQTVPDRVPGEWVEAILRRQLEFLDRQAPLLAERAASGRVIEGHGDLRPEHVCLLEPPVIFDCLEFSRSLRILDAVDELAYLGLECRRLGAPECAEAILAGYAAVCQDRPPPALLDFYRRYRAMVRAKLALWHGIDLPLDRPAHWQALLLDYLREAARD